MTIPCALQEREQDKFREGESGKTVVAVTYDSTTPVPTFETYGTPTRFFGETLSTAGSDVDVLEITSSTNLKVLTIGLSCFIEGKVTISVDGNKTITGRTAPGKPDVIFDLRPYIEVALGQVVTVTFKARPNSPQAEVESYITACEC
jgi:hypothetical protein